MRSGSSIERRMMSTPICSSASASLRPLSAFWARMNAMPPPGTMPSSTAARGVQRILDARLLLLHLGLGRGTDVDDGDATGELGQTLLQLLLVVVRRGGIDRGPDLLDAALDLRVLTGPVDDGRVVLVDDDALGAAEVRDHRVLELEADFLADDLTVGQGRDVAEHRLAAIAEARRLDGGDAQRAAELVHDQRGERLTVDVLGDDEQGLAQLRDLLERREQVLHRRDLLVVDEDVGVLEDGLHLLRIGDEVLRDVAAVELHALDRLERRLDAARFSTVITPSLPTFSIASEIRLPISVSLLAEMAPTCAISFLPVVGVLMRFSSSMTAVTALSMPRLIAIGFAPAVTFLRPSRKMAWASTVAVVVPSPALSDVLVATSFTIWAPMFSSGSDSSISFATVTPSLVTVGAPNSCR